MYQNRERERLSTVKNLEDVALMYSREQFPVEAVHRRVWQKAPGLVCDPRRTAGY